LINLITHCAIHLFNCEVGCCNWLLTQSAIINPMTRSAQPQVHKYMFCPYVISTLYQLLEESKMWTSRRYFSHALFSQLYTYQKWIKIPLLSITTGFHRVLASCLLQQKDRVVFMVQEY
jgi:hypothetical protein